MNPRASQDQSNRYKIILVGDVNVGKTALFWKYTEGDFLSNKSTVVTTVDFKMKPIKVKEETVKLYIWDTAGSEKYRSIVSTYFKGCQGVVLVFDLEREQTFHNVVDYWYPAARTKSSEAVIVLVGNKSDLSKRVSKEEIQNWCTEHKVKYFQTSVKNNQNVNEIFQWLSQSIHKSYETFAKTKSIKLDKNNINKVDQNQKCCKN